MLSTVALYNADALYGLGKLYLNRDFDGADTQKTIDYLTAAAQNATDMRSTHWESCS